ncbi:OmpA family protein [Endozoicomonas sp. 4G]|uniref:OmpA family protein n=1 Tax=Endozoicomonas sp. 4G TaxID=2872754 RepID=UPI0020787654|nr:OmpA family protein [Endozoicomonas sp. 4G]
MCVTCPMRLLMPVAFVVLLSGCASDGAMKRWGQCALIGGGTGGIVAAVVEGASVVPGGAVAGAFLGGLLCSGSSETNADFDDVINSALDSDQDGVPDEMDQCPGTPAGVAVNAEGCPDSDQDKVPDNVDQCAGTPAGVKVDAIGCPASQKLGSILFKFDKADLDSKAKAQLDQVATKLKEDHRIKLRAFGYTDSTGVDTYNEQLSKRRAEAVKQYLMDQGVNQNQVDAEVGGIVRTHNETSQGRALNRKVELYSGA